MPFFDWPSPALWKINDSVKKICLLSDVRPFNILRQYVSPFHQAFSKCFGDFVIIITGFKLKILKKDHLNFPKKLILGNIFQ